MRPCAQDDGTQATASLKAADRAMYEGKMRGKGALMRGAAAIAG